MKPNLPEEKSKSAIVQSKVIRDNMKRNDKAVFISQFNSSSIYFKAVKSGEAVINVKMAIEYPDLYKSEQNWFESTSFIKVQDQLAISVPEFIPNADR